MSSMGLLHIYQWLFQEPKLKVPTICNANFSGPCKGISSQNMSLYGTVPPFEDPEIAIDTYVYVLYVST